MDGLLVELRHEDDSCRCTTFSVHTYGSSLWPLSKVLYNSVSRKKVDNSSGSLWWKGLFKKKDGRESYLHPGFHGLHGESGEGGVEVHLESKSL